MLYVVPMARHPWRYHDRRHCESGERGDQIAQPDGGGGPLLDRGRRFLVARPPRSRLRHRHAAAHGWGSSLMLHGGSGGVKQAPSAETCLPQWRGQDPEVLCSCTFKPGGAISVASQTCHEIQDRWALTDHNRTNGFLELRRSIAHPYLLLVLSRGFYVRLLRCVGVLLTGTLFKGRLQSNLRGLYASSCPSPCRNRIAGKPRIWGGELPRRTSQQHKGQWPVGR